MANPVLNERMIQQAQKVPMAPPSGTWAPPTTETQYYPPMTDGPVSDWNSKVMTVSGTISASAVLMALLLASGAFGWVQTGPPQLDLATGTYSTDLPVLAIVGIIVGLGIAIFLAFKPQLARILAPIYAVAEGFFVGAISRQYETYYDGIVVQAVGATLGVFFVMLVLYRTGVIKVTDRFRRIVIGATMGVAVFYGICLLVRLFGGSVSFLSSTSLMSIGFSLLVAGLAAFNLALDFDFIEKGSKAGLAKHYEWYAAFGLLVTLVWLYLELLRLMAKLRSR